MTNPINARATDEIESIRAYLALAFPTKEIRTERPANADEDYDILVEPPSEVVSEMRGTYMSERVIPLTIQQWVTGRLAADDANETTEMLILQGMPFGSYGPKPSRIPVFDFSGGEPDLTDVDLVPIYWMRVESVHSRSLPADKPGDYVSIVDLQLHGWRVTKQIDANNVITGISGLAPDYTP